MLDKLRKRRQDYSNPFQIILWFLELNNLRNNGELSKEDYQALIAEYAKETTDSSLSIQRMKRAGLTIEGLDNDMLAFHFSYGGVHMKFTLKICENMPASLRYAWHPYTGEPAPEGSLSFLANPIWIEHHKKSS